MIKDFDAYLAERRQLSENGFILFGERYTLPPTLPFESVLLFKQIMSREDKDSVIEESDIVPLLESMLGKDTFDKIKSHYEFDIDLMMQVLTYVLESYNRDANPKAVTGKTTKLKRSQ